MSNQPDNRIHKYELGAFTKNGKRFVVNLRPGVPYNAVIEEHDGGTLRCWASHRFLDEEAASFVKNNATKTDKNAFIWKKGMRPKEKRRQDNAGL